MKTIEAEAEIVKEPEAKPETRTETALAVREQGGAVGQAMTLDELRTNLEFIREVMRSVMKEGQDYGKIPGCGDKPGLFQPGAQKLCMTFQLTDEVKEERVTDLPNYHREYSFVVRLTSKAGRSWEGVGTCSTLESKYRYRKAERRCPKCGKNTIIQGKAEYGGGHVCFKKKGGCGEKFAEDDQRIVSQPAGVTENENPADHWNTVRKMAFKRALVHASINATNTSELWSQDLEDLEGNRESAPAAPKSPQAKPESHRPSQAAPARKPPQAPSQPQEPFPNDESRARMIKILKAENGGDHRVIVTEFFQKVAAILPTEQLEDVPLQFVPAIGSQMRALGVAIAAFEAGEEAKLPYEIHREPASKPSKPKKAVEVPRDPPDNPPPHPEDAWFMDAIVPIPPRGMKRDEYLKHPETIGSLFDLRHGDDDESQAARQRLWGFVNHFEPKGWTKRDGTEMPPSKADIDFREALDAFAEWFEKNHPGEKL